MCEWIFQKFAINSNKVQKPNQILIQERQTKREEINMLGLDKMFIDHLEKKYC